MIYAALTCLTLNRLQKVKWSDVKKAFELLVSVLYNCVIVSAVNSNTDVEKNSPIKLFLFSVTKQLYEDSYIHSTNLKKLKIH